MIITVPSTVTDFSYAVYRKRPIHRQSERVGVRNWLDGVTLARYLALGAAFFPNTSVIIGACWIIRGVRLHQQGHDTKG